MAQTFSAKNPYNPSACTSTVYIFSGLFLANKDKIKDIPNESSGTFQVWFDSFKAWLTTYINAAQNNLLSIIDIERKLELIDVLRASLKPSEAQDLDPNIKKLQETLAKIKETRESIFEQNKKAATGFHKTAHETLEIFTHQPDMGKSHPMQQLLKRENDSQRQLSSTIERERAAEMRLRAEAQALYDQLAHRVPSEKREKAETTLAETSRPEL